MRNQNYLNLAVYLLFAVVFCSCATISNFDQYAYTQATSLKVDALNVMSLAVDEYSNHTEEVKNVQTAIQKIYEYEKNRPKNSITTEMWGKMLDTSGHLYGGFIKYWEKRGRLNTANIENEKEMISNSFDQIAQLESKKIKRSDANN